MGSAPAVLIVIFRNPRETETQFGDSSNNIKRATIGYLLDEVCQSGATIISAPYFGLVSETAVYDTDLETVKKKAVSEYNLSTAYLSRRIIGLPGETRLYDESDSLMARMTYAYAAAGMRFDEMVNDIWQFLIYDIGGISSRRSAVNEIFSYIRLPFPYRLFDLAKP